jgi:hypothetical protein
MKNRSTTANSRFAKAGVSCFYDSEVLNSSFVHLMNFSAENPRLRKAGETLGTIVENGRKGCREKWSGQWKPLQKAKCRKRGVLEKRCFWKNAACGRIFDLNENRFHCKRSGTGIYCAPAFSRKVFFDLKEKMKGYVKALEEKEEKGKKPSCFLWASALHLRLYPYRQKSRNPGAFRPENNSTQHPICPIGAARGLQCPATGHI